MTWKSLHHPNILSLIGVTMSESHFAMVSDWMVNGSINEFLRGNPNVDRLDLVCLSSKFSLRFEWTDEQFG